MMLLKTFVRRYPVALAVIFMGVIYRLTDPLADYAVFDRVIALLAKFEDVKAHEIILLLLVLIFAVAIDQTRNVARHRSQQRLVQDRLHMVQVTMATVQDIVNNALNNFIFVHIEAEKSHALSPETLATFENLITETAEKLRDINELEVVAERDLGENIRSLDLNGRGS